MPRLILPALIVALVMFGTSPAPAQVRAATLDELRNELSPGDFISLVQTTGERLSGRLVRLGDDTLDIRSDVRLPSGKQRMSVTVPLGNISSVERPRDSSANGMRTGAIAGAGVGAGMFIYAGAVDYNEIGEWAPMYLGMAAAYAGVGALVGWAIDAARSKPHLRFTAPASETMTIRVTPLLARRKGMAVVLAF